MSSEDIETARKRLIFRSWHRGTREMDLIMGRFAEAQVPTMGQTELAAYEDLLHTPDPDIYDWVSGHRALPANLMNSVWEKLLKFDYASTSEDEYQPGHGDA